MSGLRWYRAGQGEMRAVTRSKGHKFFVRRAEVRLGDQSGSLAWLYGTGLNDLQKILGYRDYQAEAKSACERLANMTDEQLLALDPHSDPAKEAVA